MNELQTDSALKAQKALEALSTLLQVTKEQEEKNNFYKEKYLCEIVLEENKRAINFRNEDLIFFTLNDVNYPQQHIIINSKVQNVQNLL